jgi:hypothetical protein
LDLRTGMVSVNTPGFAPTGSSFASDPSKTKSNEGSTESLSAAIPGTVKTKMDEASTEMNKASLAA